MTEFHSDALRGSISRREFVKVAAMGSAVFVAHAGTVQADDSSTGYIDCHSHVWTPDIKAYPLAAGKTVADLEPRSFTPEELLAIAKPHGVKRVVLIQHTQFHVHDNSYLVDTMARFPGVFSAVACIDATGSEIPQKMKVLKQQGVRGFRIRPVDTGAQRWSESVGMKQMWKIGADAALAMCPLINPEDLGEVDLMCEKFPDTTCVIDHFARVGIDGIIREAEVQKLVHLARHKHTYVKVSAFYALGKKQPPHDELIPMIRKLYDAYGPERLMWGSDCPYQLTGPNTYGDSVALIRDRIDFLTKADKECLLCKTAEKVFFS